MTTLLRLKEEKKGKREREREKKKRKCVSMHLQVNSGVDFYCTKHYQLLTRSLLYSPRRSPIFISTAIIIAIECEKQHRSGKVKKRYVYLYKIIYLKKHHTILN